MIKALNPLKKDPSIFMLMDESILSVCFNSTAGSSSGLERLGRDMIVFLAIGLA